MFDGGVRSILNEVLVIKEILKVGAPGTVKVPPPLPLVGDLFTPEEDAEFPLELTALYYYE